MTQMDKGVGKQPIDLPVAPLFLCDADSDWIEFKSLIATEHTILRPASGKRYQFIAYAADESKWDMQYESPGSRGWTRLTQFFHRPKIVVPVRWDRRGKYDVDELRATFLKAVEHDDDVLTQFV